MKVLLKEDVDNLGYAGEIYEVANGYGRNFLIPQGLAVIASPGTMKQAEIWRKKAETRRAEQRAEYEALSAQINDLVLTFQARAGETGKLYGSVTTAMIADEMNEELGTEIDRRKVGVEPLRQLGEHKVVVRLSADFQPELTVVIESDEEETLVLVETEDLLAAEEGGQVENEAEAAEAQDVAEAEAETEAAATAEEWTEPDTEDDGDAEEAS
ncbi:MAG: 50S ribosomal protein L9 [Oceanospirillum sp.]|nr:50S ribosomal protein L9 [Oceanospirillum sp.]